jgi:hypothetical protein
MTTMANKFEKIFISKAEYLYFLTLSDKELLNYIFGLYETVGYTLISGSQLASFFESIHDSLTETDTASYDTQLADEYQEPSATDKRVDVLIDFDNIVIETNSLRGLRVVLNQFMETGYILKRDISSEKMFRKDKVTRYLRVFTIIDRITGICLN